jgi:transcriptional regulator of acetoin/glycerol metabolism
MRAMPAAGVRAEPVPSPAPAVPQPAMAGAAIAATAGGDGSPPSLLDAERALLLDALRRTRWNVTQAARLLNVSRDTMRYRIEKHRLQPEG